MLSTIEFARKCAQLGWPLSSMAEDHLIDCAKSIEITTGNKVEVIAPQALFMVLECNSHYGKILTTTGQIGWVDIFWNDGKYFERVA